VARLPKNEFLINIKYTRRYLSAMLVFVGDKRATGSGAFQ
jgi:hypothetical protein